MVSKRSDSPRFQKITKRRAVAPTHSHGRNGQRGGHLRKRVTAGAALAARPCLICGMEGATIEMKVGRLFARVCDGCAGKAVNGIQAAVNLANVAQWVKRMFGG